MNFISIIFEGFSAPALYVALLWFGIAGYLATLCVVMLLTRLSFQQIMWPLLVIYGQCLIFAYLLTPVARMFYIYIMQVLFLQESAWLVGLATYNLFALLMLARLPGLLHVFFAQGSREKWIKSCTIAFGCIIFLGAFMLCSLKLIQ